MKLILRGVAEPIAIRVHEAESKRVRDEFDRDEGDARFILIETTDGDLVAVSMLDVQAANFLFDAGTFEPAPREAAIAIHLRDRAEPFITATEGPEETLRDAIASLELSDTEFISFTDDDGEDMVLRPDQIIYMVVPREFLVDDDAPEISLVTHDDEEGQR